MKTCRPNMVIVKFGNDLVSFPLAESGNIFPGEVFESTYELKDTEIIFSCFDEHTTSSVELVRYVINTPDPNFTLKTVYEDGDFPSLIQKLIENNDIIKDYVINENLT